MQILTHISLVVALALALVAVLSRLPGKSATLPTPDPPDPPARQTRLRNAATLCVLSVEQRCAILLDCLEDNTAWQIFRRLQSEHREGLALELLDLPEVPASTRDHLLEDLAENFEVSLPDLHRMLAAKPDLGARMLTSLLPLTSHEAVDLLETPHELPQQWGTRTGDPGHFQAPTVIDLLGWLRSGPLMEEDDD